MLSKIKTNPIACMIWVVLSCAVHIILFRAKVGNNYQGFERIFILVSAVCITLPIHELLHFAFMKLFGKGSVKIKVMKGPMGLTTLGTVSQTGFQRGQRLIIYLAPFVVLTLLIDLIFVFCSRIKLIFFIISICNCSGCFYDIIDAFSVANKQKI